MSAPQIDHTFALYCITADLLKAVGREAGGAIPGRIAPAAQPAPKGEM